MFVDGVFDPRVIPVRTLPPSPLYQTMTDIRHEQEISLVLPLRLGGCLRAQHYLNYPNRCVEDGEITSPVSHSQEVQTFLYDT